MNREMQQLIDAPLANALGVNLPQGRRPAYRGGKAVYEGEFAPAPVSRKELRERQVDEHSAKLTSVLDYYATTAVPFGRIAEHTKLDIGKVKEAMERRGRTA